jgi:hypothetical protein
MGQEPHGGQPQPYDPSRLRISDQDRHAVADVLRQAAGDGRIDLEELDERLEATYAAKTYADLVPITADLPLAKPPSGLPAVGPVPGAQVAPRQSWRAPVPVPAYGSSVAVMAETKRSGVWQVGAEHQAFSLMGSVVLDLRYARFTSQHLTITANTVMGGVEIIVNPFTHVVVEGVGVMGAFAETRSKVKPQLGPESPVVRVRGVALMGAVEVKRKAARG